MSGHTGGSEGTEVCWSSEFRKIGEGHGSLSCQVCSIIREMELVRVVCVEADREVGVRVGEVTR